MFLYAKNKIKFSGFFSAKIVYFWWINSLFMSSVVIHGHTFKTKISSSEIQKAVAEVAEQINKDLKLIKPL